MQSSVNKFRNSLPQVMPALCAALLALAAACGAKPDAPKPETGGEKPAPTAATAAATTTATAGSSDLKLVIVSPHNEFIQEAFEAGFNAVYGPAHNGDKVVFDWQKHGDGTADMLKFVNSEFEALGEKKDEGIGIDLFFGGGTDAFASMKERGNIQVVTLAPETLAAIPADLGGVALRDTDNFWFGTALSSFGIIYNKAGLKTKAIAEPATWDDLSNPAYEGRLVLGDPSKSSSSAVCYEVILQKEGWEKGWGSLMEIAGNTNTFAASSSQVPRDVAQGSALAGMCIDFYAYNEIQKQGPEVVGYVGPANATAVTPDPIGVLTGAPHKDIAREFIEFVLSDKGQALWCLAPGEPGGPAKQGLWRTPIRPGVFKVHQGKMLMNFNPFEAEDPFNLDMTLSNQRSKLLGPLFSAAFLNNLDGLRQAWKAVQKLPADHPAHAMFRAVPFADAQMATIAADYAANPRAAIAYDTDWQKLFRDRYKQVVESAK